MPRGRGRPVRASRPVNTANQPNNVQTRGRKRQAEEDGDSLAEDTSLQSNADVWVLGDSLPYWAGVHASDTFKSNLKIDGVSIAWWGKRGLGWSGLRRHIELQVLFSQPPKMVIINLGGNDLQSFKTPDIRNLIKQEIDYLRDAFPDTLLVWMDILPRTWPENENKPLNLKRKRLNRLGRRIVMESGKGAIITTEINDACFFRPDGIHLNIVGLEFYLDYLKDAIVENLLN
ncbi:uncharacterized protein LOC132728663 isoform X1 [Ruditapes philippinarum]|uniref:uncharacterized protein LOC132728663 isoform X1 n=1 Tax=Ruditapes philippinarum TaxID=129788 RepID=UPI00295B3993|nr:uncharacterized protein LOC132728663 isoform X1 [Ruditapes philippinarum]